MHAHPGGRAHTEHLLGLAAPESGCRILDMGAGTGETVKFLQSLGYKAEGIDLAPRADFISQGNFLHMDHPDCSFDLVISQCAFWQSGDTPGALREAFRVLRPGGTLIFSDVCFGDILELCRQAGFTGIEVEDLTPQWREYYFESLWRGTAQVCTGLGKCRYLLLLGRKESKHGFE